MNRRPNSCPLTIDDMEAGGEILKAPLGYCPQIDRETRLILRALLDDMFNHLHAYHDPEKWEDAWASAQFMHDILDDILNRNPENTKMPTTMDWLNPRKLKTKNEEMSAMYERHLDTDDIDDALLDPLFELDLDKLHHDVLVHMEGRLQELIARIRSRYRESDK